METIVKPDQSPIYAGGRVDPNAVGWTRAEKHWMRLWDIATAGNGTEIALGECSELQIYSDSPIQVAIDNPTNFFPIQNEIRLTGRMSKLFVKLPPTGGAQTQRIGRFTWFIGRPFLGVNFKRENPLDVQKALNKGLSIVLGVPNWAIGATQATATISGLFNAEAIYISAIDVERDIGVITHAYIREGDSGGNLRLNIITNEIGGNLLSLRFENPIRVAQTNWTLLLNGSAEAVATNLSVDIECCHI